MAKPVSFGPELAAIIDKAYGAADVADSRAKVLATAAPVPGSSIVDLGCGPGHMTKLLGEAVGPTGIVDGIDLSQDMLAIANRKCAALPQVSHQMGDILKLPFDDDAFDHAIAMQALSYVEDLGRAFDEIRRVLKPHGRLIILDTDYGSLVWQSTDRTRMARVLAAYDEHCVWPDLPRTLPERLKVAGWTVDTVSAVPMLATKLTPDTLIHGVIKLWRNYVVMHELIETEEADAWLAEQLQRSDAGTFFFSLDRYIFSAKPAV